MSGNRREKSKAFLLIFYSIVVSVFILDQISKHLILQSFTFGESYPLWDPFLYLTLAQNRGIAFGLFRHASGILMVLITISLLVLTWMSASMQKLPPMVRVAFAFILGGAFGNWVDRMRFGYVVDFIDVRIWPIFNFADTFISVGAGLYLLHLIRTRNLP